jgi:hypothetical protein
MLKQNEEVDALIGEDQSQSFLDAARFSIVGFTCIVNETPLSIGPFLVI